MGSGRMLNISQRLLLPVLLLAVANAGAGEIYKRMKEDGSAEYSDRPFPDGEEIEVDPNVVELAPEERRTESLEAPKAAPAPQSRAQEPQVDNKTYIYDDKRELMRRKAAQEQRRQEVKDARPRPREGGAVERVRR